MKNERLFRQQNEIGPLRNGCAQFVHERFWHPSARRVTFAIIVIAREQRYGRTSPPTLPGRKLRPALDVARKLALDLAIDNIVTQMSADSVPNNLAAESKIFNPTLILRASGCLLAGNLAYTDYVLSRSQNASSLVRTQNE